MTTLKLVRMGMEISPKDQELMKTDLDNYRLRVKFTDKDGIEVMGDFGCTNKYRFHNLYNGKKLKKPVMMHNSKLSTDLQYEREDGMTYSYKTNKIHDYITNNDLRYTKADILNLVNYLADTKYTELEISNR